MVSEQLEGAIAAGRAEDVAEEEDSQGAASEAAARTSMWTCWPSSCV